jgi:hypothetical protein
MGWQHNNTKLRRNLLGGWKSQLAEILEIPTQVTAGKV